MTGEFERIAEIRRRLGDGHGSGISLGIGDDAAVLAPSALPLVLSVDAQVEGVHFRHDLLPPQDIGLRALTAAVSDLAAMGARARAALLSVVAPASLADDALYTVIDGVATAARSYACPVVGGNLAAGGELSLTTTVVGECDAPPLTRAGARDGDLLYVVGALGGAALGLAALLAGKPELAPQGVLCWRRPSAQLSAGRAIARVASAAIDVSDGLLQDLGHLCEASGVGFELSLDRLPQHPELADCAPQLALDPLALALCGGEDYTLLFTAPASAEVGVGVRIGRALRDPGIRLLAADGSRVDPPALAGFDHFR